jgi:hypothetical protein
MGLLGLKLFRDPVVRRGGLTRSEWTCPIDILLSVLFFPLFISELALVMALSLPLLLAGEEVETITNLSGEAPSLPSGSLEHHNVFRIVVTCILPRQ